MSHINYSNPEMRGPKYTSVLINEHAREQAWQPERRVEWRIGWKAPTKMVGLLSLGIVVAIGHHCFYQQLHLDEVSADNSRWNFNSQSWAIRFGTAFAFLAKTFFAASIGVAYQQHIWTTLKSKHIKMSGVDATFGATRDIFAFFNPTFLLNVKVGAVLAALTWLMPLSAIVTPATLSVVPSTKITPQSMIVPMVDFNSTAAIYDVDANMIQSTMPSADNGVLPFLNRLMMSTAAGNAILPSLAIAPAANYSLQFFAPSFQCEKASPNITEEIKVVLNGKTNNGVGPAKPDDIPFIAYTPQNQMNGERYANVSASSSTIMKYPAFFDNCVASVASLSNSSTARAEACNGMAYYIGAGAYAKDPWAGAYLRMKANADFWSCSVRDTLFDITFNATGNLQTINHPYKFEYTSKGLNDSHYVHGQIISNFLSGVLFGVNGGRISSFRTQITQTSLIGALKTQSNTSLMGPIDDNAITQADRALTRNLTMGQLIEELSRNLTLSFFSTDRLHMPGGISTTVNIGSRPNIYNYSPTNLFLAYGVALGVTILSVLIGMRAIIVNGVSHESSFSAIMSSTRNVTLDNLTAGYSMGTESLAPEVKDTRLRFGLLRGSNDGSIRRAGFGVDGEVDDLKKGTQCY